MAWLEAFSLVGLGAAAYSVATAGLVEARPGQRRRKPEASARGEAAYAELQAQFQAEERRRLALPYVGRERRGAAPAGEAPAVTEALSGRDAVAAEATRRAA